MKPIEPGCLCLSLDSVIPGQCTAQYFVPGGTDFPSPDGIRTTILDGWSVRFPGVDLPGMVATKDLLRIDDYDASTDETQKQNEVAA